MYTIYRYSLKRTLGYLWKPVISVSFYAGLIFFIYTYYEIESMAIPLAVPTVLGTAISLILGFRTNSAYHRWWEARKIWGAIINDSRTLVRQCITFAGKENPGVISIAKKQMAFCYALANSLRNLDDTSAVTKYLNEEEIRYAITQDNVPNAILQMLEKEMQNLYNQNEVNDVQLLAVDHTFRHICNSMGMCERIKNTVFPLQYSITSRLAVFLFTLMIPFGLIGSIGAMSIPVTFIVTIFFTMIDMIARFLQDPFENRNSDIPMTNMCRTIEINLLQMIGETDIPEKTKPDAMGVLM